MQIRMILLSTALALLFAPRVGLAQQFDTPDASSFVSAVRPPETWLPLLADRTQFDSAHPVKGEMDVRPGFTRELLRVEWSIGDPIDLYIVRPANTARPPVVLFLYSWPSGTDRFRNDAWCRTVAQHGFAAVGFVSALTGQRYHDRPWKEWFVSELPEVLGKSVHDVRLQLDYLGTRADLDIDHAGIFGQGSGGTVALLTASVEPRLKAIDVIDPWADWPDWYGASPIVPDWQRVRYVTEDFQKRVSSFEPIRFLPALDGRSLRLQESTLNPSTPAVAREKLRNALPKGANYTLYKDETEYRLRAMADGKILDWLQALLAKPETIAAGNSSK